jgi:hypothetical protein
VLLALGSGADAGAALVTAGAALTDVDAAEGVEDQRGAVFLAAFLGLGTRLPDGHARNCSSEGQDPEELR